MTTRFPLLGIRSRESISHINRKIFILGILALLTIILAAVLMQSESDARFAGSDAQMQKVTFSMSALKAKTAELGSPKIEGMDAVANKKVPALYFGASKMNNAFDVVDGITKEHGGTATLFVKAGDAYVRVATNVMKDDGSRATGTILDPNGPAIRMIKKGQPYYGEATILGKQYVAGYDPIKDASGAVIGIYYVGFLK
jgi:hypothetical protein